MQKPGSNSQEKNNMRKPSQNPSGKKKMPKTLKTTKYILKAINPKIQP